MRPPTCRNPSQFSTIPPCAPGKISALVLAAALVSGCGGGYETVTTRGEGVKEWFLPLQGGRIEANAVWPSHSAWFAANKRRPALLLLHAAKGRAQRYRRAMFSLVKQGLVTMSISLPGFGESTGPEDFAGPRSVEAAVRAVKYLAERRDVLENGVAIYGQGQGATTALLTAARSQYVRLVIVEGGVYDLRKAYEKLPPTERERLRFIVGGTAAEKPTAYKLRSPIHKVGRLRGPVMILHSKDNRRFPLSEAEDLAAALRNQGRLFSFVMTEGRLREFNPGHPSLKKWVTPFMKKHFAF